MTKRLNAAEPTIVPGPRSPALKSRATTKDMLGILIGPPGQLSSDRLAQWLSWLGGPMT